MRNFTVLSLMYTHHDTAAALMRNGELVAACEQERYTRDKHSRRFPAEAAADCLKIGGIGIEDIDEIACPFVPEVRIREMFLRPALESDSRLRFMMDGLEGLRKTFDLEKGIREQTGFEGPMSHFRHHLCHLASAYYPSGFDEALLLSMDGIGEVDTSMLGVGREGTIEVVHNDNRYPHSLGLLYGAVTHFLGWKYACDEGIVMGLAPYGDPYAPLPGGKGTYYDVFSEILREEGDFGYVVDQSWMAYYEVRDVWISEKFTDTFGPRRESGEPLRAHHRNIAAALQKRLETVVLNQLGRARNTFGIPRLALAGGVALNCSMNGRILGSGIFDEIFVQPASGDPGVTVGACFLASRARDEGLRPVRMHDFYKGSRSSDGEIESALRASGCSYSRPGDVYALAAQRLEEGRVVAWFNGGAEFGPRALGNRSILCRPYPADMKDHLNARVKFREAFRPFAPAVLREHAGEYFHIGQESPHMLMAVQAREEKADAIPAVIHVDGSCRVQTVSRENNEPFFLLLNAFYRRTGVPVLLNTSFNVKGQPIVNTPAEAIECFKSTRIDCLVLSGYIAEKDG